MTARTFSVTHHDKPWTLNDIRHQSSWRVEQRRIKAWRQAFRILAHDRDFKQFARVTVTVEHHTRTRRLADTCAIVAAYKAGLDGLVDAGVLPDDSPEHVTAVTFLPPARTGQDGLTITLTEVTP